MKTKPTMASSNVMLQRYVAKYGLQRCVAWLRAAAHRFDMLSAGNPGRKTTNQESRELNAALKTLSASDMIRIKEMLKRGRS